MEHQLLKHDEKLDFSHRI